MVPYVFIRNDRFDSVPSFQQQAVTFPHFIRSGPRAEDFVVADVLDRLTREAVSFVGEAASRQAPFFLYLPFTAPHKPTQPHERFRGKTGLNEYGDFVAQVDAAVGEVLGALDRAGVADKTLVIYTSDNGSYMNRFDAPRRKDHVEDPSVQGYRAEHHRPNGPFRGTKADIWEAGHHVPLLMRWPGRILAGQSNMEGKAKLELLDYQVKAPNTREFFAHLWKNDAYVVRNDVFWDAKVAEMVKTWRDNAEEWKKNGSDYPYHYLGSAKIFCNIGRAFGEAMVELQGVGRLLSE